MIITESSIKLNFPDENFFRFQDKKIYKKLSGFSFKEVDACWLDKTKNIFYLIELKDFTKGNIENKNTRENKIWELVKKSLDCLQLLLSKKLNTNYFQKFKGEDTFDFPNDAQLFFITIIYIKKSQREYLGFIRDAYKNKFQAYQKLFNLKCTIISREKAVERFSWIEIPD